MRERYKYLNLLICDNGVIEVSKSYDIPVVLDRLLEVLRKRLINEVLEASCPKCGRRVYYRGMFAEGWEHGHTPYYTIEDTVEVGYRCPTSEYPIVIFKVSLGSLIKELKGEIEGAR